MSAAYEKRKARGPVKNRKTEVSFGYAVVPMPFARQALAEAKKQITRDLVSRNDNLPTFGHDPSAGWKQVLGERIALTTGNDPDSYYRRAYSIEKGLQKWSKAEVVDAILDSVDLTPNVDVPVPVLPGCMKLAREAAEVYAELNPDKNVDVEKMATETKAFADAIMQYDWPSDDEPVVVPDDFALAVNNLEFLAQIKELVRWPSS